MSGDSFGWRTTVPQAAAVGQIAVTKDPAAMNGGDLSSIFQQFSPNPDPMLARLSPGAAAAFLATSFSTSVITTQPVASRIAGFMNSGTAVAPAGQHITSH
jgi:hypothetical protein